MIGTWFNRLIDIMGVPDLREFQTDLFSRIQLIVCLWNLRSNSRIEKNVHVCLHVCWDLSNLKHTCKCAFLFRFINKRNPKHQMFSKGNPEHCKRNPKPWISRQQEKPKPANFLPRGIPTGRVPAKRLTSQPANFSKCTCAFACMLGFIQHTCNCVCMFGFLAKGRNSKQQIYHQEKS